MSWPYELIRQRNAHPPTLVGIAGPHILGRSSGCQCANFLGHHRIQTARQQVVLACLDATPFCWQTP
jgi:hypothetical protein